VNAGQQRAGVELTDLDQPLGPDSGAALIQQAVR
jgi:hypothetical protein